MAVLLTVVVGGREPDAVPERKAHRQDGTGENACDDACYKYLECRHVDTPKTGRLCNICRTKIRRGSVGVNYMPLRAAESALRALQSQSLMLRLCVTREKPQLFPVVVKPMWYLKVEGIERREEMTHAPNRQRPMTNSTINLDDIRDEAKVVTLADVLDRSLLDKGTVYITPLLSIHEIATIEQDEDHAVVTTRAGETFRRPLLKQVHFVR